MKVDILGTVYDVRLKVDPKDDNTFSDGRLGYCATLSKRIVVADTSKMEAYNEDNAEERTEEERRVLRHEIIHAFLRESGLWYSSCESESWATNEEMVDWFALQWPKIQSVFNRIIKEPMKPCESCIKASWIDMYGEMVWGCEMEYCILDTEE